MSNHSRRLFHYSEDPSIRRFVPHVPKTNPNQLPAVWAIDETHAPLYWFPRDCPRGTVWGRDQREVSLLQSLFHTSSHRLHVTESTWRDRIWRCELYRYSFSAETFLPWPDAFGTYVSHSTVSPLHVEPIHALIQRHEDAGIELRFVNNVWPFWDAVVASGLPFSGVRLSLAKRRAAD